MFALAGTQPQILQVYISNIGSHKLWWNTENFLFEGEFKRMNGDVISHWMGMQFFLLFMKPWLYIQRILFELGLKTNGVPKMER